MDWLFVSFYWYFVLLFLGIIFFPLTKRLLPDFFDQGYAFAKTVAIVLLSYSMLVLGVTHILPFSQPALFGLIAAFALLSLFIVQKYKTTHITRSTLFIMFFEEVLFLASLIFLVYIRGQEPSVRGLEKFMDFGFINSILRSTHFPPLDMWLSADPTQPQGYPINYYYFGHLTGALLIKLTQIKASIGYNLILATIFAQAMTMGFSLVLTMVGNIKKSRLFSLFFYGILGTFFINLSGNLHTIYLFTKGYSGDEPTAFWKIFSGYSPQTYWYPNATRFIPFTIHEFPSYSYVVADLHGHVFDIPFVLLTLALLFSFFILFKTNRHIQKIKDQSTSWRAKVKKLLMQLNARYLVLHAALFGFMVAIHYMTNAFDGPIYLLLIIGLLLILLGFTRRFFISIGLIFGFFIFFSLPFSVHFSPFVSGIGVNCSPDFLVAKKSFGPFLFEQNNCQASALWMLFVLWGFFFVNAILFLLTHVKGKIAQYTFALFALGTLLLIIPEFFYIKDIYPSHFRANTMFKLGYQAFIMMSIASTITLFFLAHMKSRIKYLFLSIFFVLSFFVLLYPFYSFRSYYGDLKKSPRLDGDSWLLNEFPSDKEIIDYLNIKVADQPVILEAQGDSYTDYERISTYTGLPTVAGWWVHEWLWRGSSDVVGVRIPEIAEIYESRNLTRTEELLEKYGVRYIVVSRLEKEKYPNLYQDKFSRLGKKIFESTDKFGALYQYE